MKLLSTLLLLVATHVSAQTKKIEMFDLVKKLSLDSSQYESVGEWGIGSNSTYPIKWNNDRIEMSDDLKINFFRKGSANISINGVTYQQENKSTNWSVMLKGARAGYSSFNISGANLKDIKPKMSIDSLFPKKQFTYKLLQDCSSNLSRGFYYYQFKIPKKATSWLKISWICNSGSCILSLDVYDEFSKQYAELACPK